MKTVLVTGAHGFLGRNTAHYFSKKNYRVLGIGHGHWGLEKPENFGISKWLESDVNQAGLSLIDEQVDFAIHCAGGSSVGHSVNHPFGEFQRTVDSTLHLLEYIRTKQSKAKLVYPSSAAVYGDQPDIQILESSDTNPVSPYGYYKKITEELCKSYYVNFGIPCVIVRLFSVYGSGLEKQLLWDGCRKLTTGRKHVNFFGTGDETRDWINVKDAASLLYHLAMNSEGYEIYNGGSGTRVKVSEVLKMLIGELGVDVGLEMGGEAKDGDPRHYWADINKAKACGWKPEIGLDSGLKEYIEWFKQRAALS